MRRLTAWLAGFVGGAAVYRLFKRGPQPATERDPAEALKAKLAEAKGADAPPQPSVEGSPPEEPADVESRRSSVHDRARAAIDEMHSQD